MFGFLKKDNSNEVVLELPFRVEIEKEEDVFGINIEAVGEINGITKYFYACYNCSDEQEVDGIYNILSAKQEKIKVKVNVNKPQKFKIDLDDLGEKFGNEAIKKLDLIGWGANDTSSINA